MTTQEKISKKAWVAMFEEIGLTEEQMMAWHGLFETRHPDAHEEFLNWLGIETAEVEGIRKASREKA